MDMVKILKYFTVLLLTTVHLSLFSQTQGVLGKRFTDNWSVGIGAGPNIFFGDLKVFQFWPATSNMNEVKFGGTFTLTKQLSHVFALRGQFLYSELSGTKRIYSDGTPCNQYFDGNILEGNLNTTINFSNLFSSRYKPKRIFFIYGTVGLGTSSWYSKVKELGTGNLIRVSDPAGKWTTKLMAMAGVGAYVNVIDKVNIGLEWTLHGVNSDRVDVTAGGFKYDAYSMLSLNITYNFNKHRPGKEPDTNANKIYVPVYINVPVKETKPVDSVPPKIEPPADTTMADTLVSENALTDSVGEGEIPVTMRGEGLTYSVQIYAFKNDKYSAQEIKEKYNLSQDVFKDFSGGYYCFSVGFYTDYNEARAVKNQMRKKGFKGAFVTSYNNGVRVPVHRKK